MHGTARRMRRTKRWFFRRWKSVVFFLIVVLVCLVLAEVVLRLFVQPYYGTPPGMFVADDVVDFVPTPGFVGYFLNSEHPDKKIEISINSDGLRDVEHAVENIGKRIVLLGDSFTMAEQVQLYETYGKVLEDSLDVEIINLGVSGYGTGQAFEFFKMKGEKYDPDAVVYAFTTNDLTDNLKSKYTVVYGERLGYEYKDDASALLIMKIFVYRHSALLRTLYRVVRNDETVVKADDVSYFDWYGGEEAWLVMDNLLEDMDEYFDERGIEFVVMYTPSYRRLQEGDDLFDRERLQILTGDLGILFIDPTDTLVDQGVENFYFPLDGHWNVEGHRFIGEHLATIFISEDLL